jgi:hypothetical protein
MLSEISSLKTIFKETILEFSRLNMKWLKELIETLLDLHQSAYQGSLNAEANEIFSPPKKPNLSPIPSAKRLSSSSSQINRQPLKSQSYMTFSPDDL